MSHAEPQAAGSIRTGLLESLASYALGAAGVLAAVRIPLGPSGFWAFPILAFAGSLWVAAWHGSHGRPRTARGAYIGTVLFLVLLLIAIVAMFAYAMRHLNVKV